MLKETRSEDIPQIKFEIKKERKLSAFEQKLNDLASKITGVPFVDKMLFIHHLQIMIKAGLSIMEGLKILGKETQNKKLLEIINEIKIDVEKGNQFSEALSKYPKIFPSLYVSMIAAGETAGKMEDALKQVYDQMKKNHDLSSTIRGAMIYPAVILIAMVGVGALVVFYIMPQILVMFEEFDSELPLATRVLMWIVEFSQKWVILIVIFIVSFISGWIRMLKVMKFKRIIHKLNLKLPIAGKIIKKINLARFSLTLSSLLKSSIPIIDAVNIASEVVGNYTYKDILKYAAENLKKGETLSSILLNFPSVFPPMVTEMIMVGEETGQSENMLNELSTYFSDEVDATMKNFSTIIEPVIILTLGLGVAGIAVSVLMPMYSMTQNF